jgi:hypothetical protein
MTEPGGRKMEMSDLAICTIIAKNYIAFARTLCASFHRYHPEGRCHVLIIDDYRGYIDPAVEEFEVVELSSLGIADLKKFCFRYNVTELATACKPFLLEFLLAQGIGGKLLYMDPDILVTAPLDDLSRMLDGSDIIVTPHLDRDFFDDGLKPDDSVVMTHGVFNLGFIGVKKCGNTLRFLQWWQGKLSGKCLIDYKRGYFVDQKFMDLAITLFRNITIVSDPGYNVSYWNLHSRVISSAGEEWRCNDGRLHFYHFSSFKPEHPEVMSTHQNRFNLAQMPDLGRLYRDYARIVMENGYSETRCWPYTFNCFSNGEAINNPIRKVYRTDRRLKGIADPFQIASYHAGYRVLFGLLRLYKRCTGFILGLLK